MDKTSYLYIVRCRNGSLYTGVTSDLDKRIKDHNAGKGGKFTRLRRPVKLVYHEVHSSLSSARLRENEIKDWRRGKREALISGGSPRLIIKTMETRD